MVGLASLLVALIVEGQSSRQRSQELRGRLGLVAERMVGLRARLAWLTRQPGYNEGVKVFFYDVAYNDQVPMEPHEGLPDGWDLLALTPNIVTRIDPLISWLWREVQQGRIYVWGYTEQHHPDMVPGRVDEQEIYNRIEELAAWFHAVHPELFNTTIASALIDAHHWHINLEAADQLSERISTQLEAQGVLKRWDDGWTLVRLQTPADLDAESVMLGHCIGHGGYDRRLTSGRFSYLSLRDPDGNPRVTFERQGELPATLDVLSLGADDNRVIVQARARRNMAPSGRLLLPTIRALLAMQPSANLWPKHAVEAVSLENLPAILALLEGNDLEGWLSRDLLARVIENYATSPEEYDLPYRWEVDDDQGDIALLHRLRNPGMSRGVHIYTKGAGPGLVTVTVMVIWGYEEDVVMETVPMSPVDALALVLRLLALRFPIQPNLGPFGELAAGFKLNRKPAVSLPEVLQLMVEQYAARLEGLLSAPVTADYQSFTINEDD